MKRITLALLAVVAVGCQKIDKSIDSVNAMPAKMDGLQEKINRQGAFLTFKELVDETNAEEILPIPFDLMGFAKEFGKFATVEDLVELFYLYNKKLNEVVIDSAAPTPEEIKRFNHKKSHELAALQAVAGLLPQEKVQAVIDERIMTDDRYRDAGLTMLMMRVQFLRDVLLELSLFSEPIDVVGEFEKAIEYGKQIDFVARLPFTKYISMSVTGFIETERPDVVEQLDPAVALATWKKIRTKATRGLGKIEVQEWTGNAAQDQAKHQERLQRFGKGLYEVEKAIQSWEGTQP
jgi:hypothetical protein